MATGDSLSVVIPSWREGARLLDAVRAARLAIGAGEIVVVAHGETRELAARARSEGVVWVDAPHACRGLQMKLGAERSSGHILLFLHADTRLPMNAGELVRAALADATVAGGAFSLRFDSRHPVLNALSLLSRLRLNVAFTGDQCLFCTRDRYLAAGAFRVMPLFEDVEFMARLARHGRLVRIREPVTTSARRFLRNGPLRQVAMIALLMLAYHAGVSPERLSSVYQSAPKGSRSAPRARARRVGLRARAVPRGAKPRERSAR
jgi:rSAM/selenodomain-associated transferase 2